MNHVWSGTIDLGPQAQSIHHARFEIVGFSSSSPVKAETTLQYLALIDTAAVPFYLANGPSLNVHLQEGESASQLARALANECEPGLKEGSASLSLLPNGQSRCGLLLRACTHATDPSPHAVTEILVYATARTSQSSLPSPPTSSSPSRSETTAEVSDPRYHTLEYDFHALPLCSNILHRARQASGLCTPPPDGEGAFFIPNNDSEIETALRRRKMSSVFDAATQERRKSKAKGGEGVARVMASLERSRSQGQKRSSIRGVDESSQQQHFKPDTLAAEKKQTSLDLVDSASVAGEPICPSGMATDVLEQNKTALSKLIMAGMRLYGLQQRRKPAKPEVQSSQPTHLAQIELGHNSANDDEYKQIYHQTLKAALFACRAHGNERLIQQDCMRDVVDKLLAIFCVDPLPSTGPGMIQTPGFASTGNEHDNPFDAPSSSSARAEINVFNTPIHRKRKRNDESEPG